MRLVTFRRQGLEEIGAFVDEDRRIVRLQAAQQLQAGRTSHHLGSMLAFLQGGLAARDTARAALEFALCRSPNEVVGSVQKSNCCPLCRGRNPSVNSWCSSSTSSTRCGNSPCLVGSARWTNGLTTPLGERPPRRIALTASGMSGPFITRATALAWWGTAPA